MEKRYSKSRSQEKARVTVPEKFEIKKPAEPGFEIETCMNDFKAPSNTYEQNSDYYFDSYGHFGIHEEMLKDRVPKNTLFSISYMYRLEPSPTETLL